MSRKIQKIVFFCLWAIAGAGVAVLLVAAMSARKKQLCTGYAITVNGQTTGNWFINRNDIVQAITLNGSKKIQNRKIDSFNLHQIEARLKKEVWIRDAEVYFDNNGTLRVSVDEREPIARIISSSGQSFYIDSTGKKLPLSDKMTARLPVFTSFPGEEDKAAGKKCIKQVQQLSLYLLQHPFWMAQIAQVNITSSEEFEMVPTVGNHLIEFGSGEDCERKFAHLMIFYRQVLAKVGMEKYERIRLQYGNQVIGVKKEP